MSKITKSARGEDCSLRIPGVCNFDPATTVFCHAPCVDKGMGYKSPSWWGSYGCSSCHDYIDGRGKFNKWGATDVDDEVFWMPAIYETQKKLFAKGLL